MTDHNQIPPLGAEGDTCSACAAPLAIDQRYCLQCGQRRGASRVDFAELLPSEETTTVVGRSSATATGQGLQAQQGPWTPLALVGSIATLGLMLLLGVMIGKDDSPTQVTAAAPVAPVASTDATETAGGGAETASTGSGAGGSDAKQVADKGADGANAVEETAPASEAPGAETVDAGALDELDQATGQEAADASKNLPDTIALPGEPPPVDNEAPGAGSDAQVIK